MKRSTGVAVTCDDTKVALLFVYLPIAIGIPMLAAMARRRRAAGADAHAQG